MVSPVLRTVGVGGGRRSYLELGDPAGPVLVLVPGLSDGLAPITEPAARASYADVPLPMERFRGLVLSHRVTPGQPASTRELAADLAEMLDRLLDRPAVLIGHSMGSMVAQHLAVDRPDLVRGLALTATSGRADPGMRAVLDRWDELLAARRFVAFAHDAIERSFTGREHRVRWEELQTTPPESSTQQLIDRHLLLSAACGTHDAAERLGGIVQPTLVLAAELDAVVPVAHARQVAAAIPGADLAVLPGVSHGFPDQEPDQYRALVLPFIDRVIA